MKIRVAHLRKLIKENLDGEMEDDLDNNDELPFELDLVPDEEPAPDPYQYDALDSVLYRDPVENSEDDLYDLLNKRS